MLKSYEDDLKIARVLADADPRDAQKQRDLSVSFEKLGDVFLTLGRTDDVLKSYEDGLKIRLWLADADPRDAQKQRDLMVSYYKLGLVDMRRGKYDAACGRFEAGIAVLDRLIGQGLTVAASTREKVFLQQKIQECRKGSGPE